MKTIIDLVTSLQSYFTGKDTAAKRAVEANIAPVETDATESVGSYAIGDQLILNDVLYDVTAAITAGDALTVGTNITAADTITEQISDNAAATAGKENAPTILTQTLAAGSTTLTFTDANIGNSSRISPKSDPFVLGLITNMVQSGTTITVTCAAQASAVSVMLEVYN